MNARWENQRRRQIRPHEHAQNSSHSAWRLTVGSLGVAALLTWALCLWLLFSLVDQQTALLDAIDRLSEARQDKAVLEDITQAVEEFDGVAQELKQKQDEMLILLRVLVSLDDKE